MVILSLLFMFVLIAITYVLVTTRHLTISRQYGRMAATGHSQQPRKEFDSALLELLRGSTTDANNRYRTPIATHSLLDDMYGPAQPGSAGNGSVRGQITVPPPPTTGEGFNPRLLTGSGNQILEFIAFDGTNAFDRPEDFYQGCLLTMLSGPAKGLTTRIVDYRTFNFTYPPPTPRLRDIIRVFAFQGGGGQSITPQDGDEFLINGRPFTGTGFGYNRASGKDDAMFDAGPTSIPHALLPNPLFYDTSGAYLVNSNDYAQAPALFPDYPNNVPPFGGPGGANEDYDAVDYQNMALAWVPPDTVVRFIGPPPNPSGGIIPSFHRQALIRYFAASIDPNVQAIWQDLTMGWNLRQKIMLRPFGKTVFDLNTDGVADDVDGDSNPDLLPNSPRTQVDHPNFTGSNPNTVFPGYFDPVNGPWDVDNDGDGVPDSVWLDLGAPVHSTADGRLYKPLFAILCIDLDGRVNVNAHGNAAQTASIATGSSFNYTGVPINVPAVMAGGPALAGNPAPGTLLMGSGFGPADVYPGALVPANKPEFMQRLLWGDGSTFEGRYGNFGIPYSVGAPLVGYPGNPGTYDAASTLHLFNFPISSYPYSAGPLTSFMTPLDVWGRRILGLDYAGRPQYAAPVDNTDTFYASYFTKETTDDPYELNLNSGGSRPASGAYPTPSRYDSAFTVYELERLLRPYDIDQPGLAPRLEKLLEPYLISNPTLARRLTTESFDVPVPHALVPPDFPAATEVRDDLYPSLSGGSATIKTALNVKNLLRARLINAGVVPPNLEDEVNKMLSWDLRDGGRMNINRPLGDGRDGNGNNIVDEPVDVAYGAPFDNGNAELATEGKAGVWTQPPNPPSGANFVLDNGLEANVDLNLSGGPPDAADDALRGLMARQLMARHLYVLMMLLHDTAYDATWTGMPVGPGTDDPAVTGYEAELFKRRIAQWAVNVVDFMDPDSIMTPFEYDKDPFTNNDPTNHPNQTWEVDGVIDADPVAHATITDDDKTWRRLVWGCETPALVLTESLAFHDRRVKDTAWDPSQKTRNDMPTNDPTYDQVRIPQGSAFFELYCVGNPNAPVQPGDLYTYQGNQWYLDLGRMAPKAQPTDPNYPVWRLAITERNDLMSGQNDMVVRSNTHPETMSFDVENQVPGSVTNNPSSLVHGSAEPPISIERLVWFTDQPPTPIATHPDVNMIYYRRGGTELMNPGQYAVIGPRTFTRIGWTTHPQAVNNPYESPACEPSKHKILLNPGATPTQPGQVLCYDNNSTIQNPAVLNYPTEGNEIQSPLAIIAASNPPAGWTPAERSQSCPDGIGVNISEPLFSSAYYAAPDWYRDGFDTEPTTSGTAGVKVYDCYGDLTEDNTIVDPKAKCLDNPLDTTNSFLTNRTGTGTYVNFKTVLLQRLANPLAPYHPKTNPYLTVDWMPIDLTVFNGHDNPPPGLDLDDPAPDSNPPVHFTSRQRGNLSSYQSNLAAAGLGFNSNFNLWRPYSDDPTDTEPIGGPSEAIFKHRLRYYGGVAAAHAPDQLDDGKGGVVNGKGGHTLGFLNGSYGYPLTSATDGAVIAAGANPGDPRKPFPWIVWNNRPFNSIFELMQVPASHPGRLYWEFDMPDGNPIVNPYDASLASAIRFPFRHLLNFLHASSNSGESPNFHRIFEYLEVPSPFVGTDMVLNPNVFDKLEDTIPPISEKIPDPVSTPPNNPGNGTQGLHPPYCTISQFRDPGRVNINTITSDEIWNALANGTGISWNILEDSRRGFPDTPTDRQNHPTDFANPFRSPAGAALVPPLVSPLPATLEHTNGTSVSLLRREGFDPDNATTSPLLDLPANTPMYNSASRNSHFYYQGLDRLANLVTTRSNVYSVWITIGYFEVTPWYGRDPTNGVPYTSGNVVYDAAHPDGYQLGQELGMDTGDVDRHRAFYIIDRSIPVGYERGQNHNVEKAILLKRFIE